MAQGDGLRAKCPYFKARVNWAGASYIQCLALERWMCSFVPVCNHHRVFLAGHHLYVHGCKRRDEVYKSNCCNGGYCFIREQFEQGGLQDADV